MNFLFVLLFSIQGLKLFPTKIGVDDVVVVKKTAKQQDDEDPWIGVVKKKEKGKKYQVDWFERDAESATWNFNNQFSSIECSMVLATIATSWKGGIMSAELDKEIRELYSL